MADVQDDSWNQSRLSLSYMKGVKRITGNQKPYEDDYKTSEEVLQSRKKTWSWLFEKFSEISDDIELNIQTLKPSTESSGSNASEVRIPVRKSSAQIQYWIDTGNPPCQAMEAEASDSEETVSISETEATDDEEGEFSPCASMMVNKKLTNSGEHLMATESSASSVDTAAYILRNKNSARKKERDNSLGNLDNNIVARSINAVATPRVLLSRSMESPKTAQVYERISVLHKSMSADVAENPDIILDKSISRKIDEGLEKGAGNYEVKDSEVTFESKTSGIGSLAVESIEKGEAKEAKKSSDSSDALLSVPRQSQSHRRRKLYTKDNDMFDMNSPVVKSVRKIRYSRQSFHPALNSPSTTVQKKAVFRPMMWGMKRLKNYAINRRTRNKSLLSKSKVVKNSDISQRNTLKSANSVETRVYVANEVSNRSLTVGADGAEGSTIAEETSAEKGVATKSPVRASSSLSSNDVSQIINEEMNKISTMPVAGKRGASQIGHFPVPNVQTSQNKDCNDDQGSIFEPSVGSSSKSDESKMRGILLVRKNLCATDLKSLDDTASPSCSNSGASAKVNGASVSNESMILLPGSEALKADLITLSPKVVLHDFLDLKKCCGELERENSANWLRKKGETQILEKEVEQETGKDSRNGWMDGSKRQQKSMDEKVSVRKKRKLRNKPSRRSQKILFTTQVDLVTDDSHESEEDTTNFRAEKQDNDFSRLTNTGSNGRQADRQTGYHSEIETSRIERSTITFTNTNHDRWESIFVLPSSDEEDLLKKLRSTSRSSRKNMKENDGRIEATTSVVANTTVDDSGEQKSAKTAQDCYKIVYSSSGDDEKTEKTTRARTVTKKYSKRNKRKNSPESEPTNMSSREDECGDLNRSEGLRMGNEKLEKQSPGVNILSETKRSKQSPLVARSKADREARSERKLRREKARRKARCESEVVVSSEIKDSGGVSEPEINDKENEPNTVSENLETPVEGGVEKRQLSPKSWKRDIFRKIANAAGFSESEDEPEVRQEPNYKDRSKRGPEIEERDDKARSDVRETRIAPSAFLLLSNDESSDDEDAFTFLCSKNYAGDNSREKINRRKDKCDENEGLNGPNKRGIKVRRNGTSSSKKKATNRRFTNSKIVFRTKEYWESDSDKS